MKKVLTVILSAVLFGALAGGTMLGINALSNKLNNKETAAIEQEETREVAAEEETQEIAPEGEKTSKKSTNISNESSTSIKQVETKEGAVIAMDVSDVVEACMPEVVAITNTTVIKQQGYASFYDYFYGRGTEKEYTQTASGSGVIIADTGSELLIVTNKHVVEDATELEVTFIDGTTAKADLKGTGSDVDIAVIAIQLSDIEEETRDTIKVAKLHEEEDLKPGQGVIAIGNALGYGQSVTVGVISAIDRTIQASTTETYENLIQTDAAINPGNSGGALLNNEGELIGINVAKLATTEVEGMGFAIPLYKVGDVIEELSNVKTRVEIPEENQGRLGIYMNTISESQSAALNMPAGVIIMGFSDEAMEGYEDYDPEYSPAKEAGLLKNDIITKFDGQTVTDAQELSALVKYYEAGSDVVVTVQRINNGEYEEKEFTVTLGRKTVTDTEDEEASEKKEGENSNQNGFENGRPGQGQDPGNQGGNGNFGGGANGQNPGREDSGRNGSGNEDSGNTEDGQDSGTESYGDMYEFFRKYLEQYQ